MLQEVLASAVLTYTAYAGLVGDTALAAVQRKGGIVSDIGVYAGFCSHFNIG